MNLNEAPNCSLYGYIVYMGREKHRNNGLGLAILAMVMIGGWRMMVVASRPAHLQAIAAEFAAIGKFVLSPPAANKPGDKLLFYQTTDQGVGLFLLDTTSGQKRLVYVQSRKNLDPTRVRILDWAPDGSRFAYQQHQPEEHLYSEIVVCDGNSGQVLTSQSVHEQMSGFG